MKPLKLEFQAFGPYPDYECIDFDALSSKGLFLICGETGSGKTMMLDAMTFALYGKSSGRGRDDFEAMRCTTAEFDKSTFVKFFFSANGTEYMFERRLDRRRKNLNVSYNLQKREPDGEWEVLFENPKEKDLNNKAVEIIGLEYEQFSQVMVLPQGKFERLLTSTSDEKEKILISIFGEDKWQRICEFFYDNIAETKEQLRIKKDRIQARLTDENCESLDQLDQLIEFKQQTEKELIKRADQMDYDNCVRDLQNKLAIAKRFGDLHRAEERMTELVKRKELRDDKEKSLEDAKRAEKVRGLIDAAQAAANELVCRQEEHERALERVSHAEADSRKNEADILEHAGKEADIEAKKKTIIVYEGKRTDYDLLREILGERDVKQKEYDAALEKENTFKTKYDDFGPRIQSINAEYDTLTEEHSDLLHRYLAGITGELAKKLVSGEPCPVCGSTEHPAPAVNAEDSVSKEDVDAKKQEAESKYADLQTYLKMRDTAKTEYDASTAERSRAEAELAAARTKFDGVSKNLIEGIGSIEELEAEIDRFNETVNQYTERKNELEKAQKAAAEKVTQEKASLEAAIREMDKAHVSLDNSNKQLMKGLSANDFADIEEARKLLMSEEEADELQKYIARYDAEVLAAKKAYEEIQSELKGIDEPNEEECNNRLSEINEQIKALAGEREVVSSELERLITKRDAIKKDSIGLDDAIRQTDDEFRFAKKLRGDTGTSLQRYVLGIMFSSVITAANKMLELVHSGRYRLFRSDEMSGNGKKRGLELKVYDKFSDDSEGRFVNTLSGGEKFLASLALSIGMSTVAQKSGIRIEALFIDEGFGSLDEDSIEDAMNILNSIRAANGMVGIISHVQILQDRIPTKLIVSKGEGRSHIVETIG